MSESWDDELRKTPDENLPPTDSSRRLAIWIVSGLLLVSAIVAAYVLSRRPTGEKVDAGAASPVADAAAAPEAPAQPLGGEALTVNLPPLDASDALVRELVGRLSSHPRVSAWLATDGLIRNFTVVVTNIAEGKTPARLLGALRPSSAFRVMETNGQEYADPRSFQRYKSLADAMASIDPAGSARLYATLKPRIEEAHRDLGYLDSSFDRALERAIILLLATPVPNRPMAVEPRGIVYGFVDPNLESLQAAQKQLLRMGPDNARTVQRALREIALALGIPQGRLPS